MPNCKPHDPVTVSAVIGDGPDAHRIARVGDWTLTLPGADSTEPEIPDTELAPRLGMEPRRLRELSERHEKAGNIAPRFCRTVRQNRGRPGMQRFYNEADALFLVTRSETPKAVALTREMIAVYMAVRRGIVPTADPATTATVAALVAQMKQITEAMAAFATTIVEVASDAARRDAEVKELRDTLAVGVIGDAGAKTINRALNNLAHMRGGSDAKRVRSCRRRDENRLRKVMGFDGRGSKWANLPRAHFAFVERWIDAETDDVDDANAKARRAAEERAKAAQGELFNKN